MPKFISAYSYFFKRIRADNWAHLDRGRLAQGSGERVGPPGEAHNPRTVAVKAAPLRGQAGPRQVKVDDVGGHGGGQAKAVGEAPVRAHERRGAAVQGHDRGEGGGVKEGDDAGFLGNQDFAHLHGVPGH